MTPSEAAGEPAPTRPRTGRAPRKGWLREVLEALLVALVFAVFARTWVVQAFKIPTGSMEENLLVGDHILVNKFVYGPTRHPVERILLPVREPRRGDVVVFKYPVNPRRDFIKRCVGLPGDEVEIRDKGLIVNGEPVDEEAYTYITDPQVYPDSAFVPEHYRLRDQLGPTEVPTGHYFCLGDNRDRSHDSRYWGSVPEEHLKGRALLVYWSVAGEPEHAGPATPERSVLGRLGDAVRGGTRWERTFTLVR